MRSFENAKDNALKNGQELQKAKTEFVRYNVDECGGDEKIIQFIADILFHGARDVSVEDSVETVRYLFEAGYCYYFAKMLEDAFPGGVICLCYDFGHVVYVYEEIAYDIHGVSDAEAKYYVPIRMLGKAINSFKHVQDEFAVCNSEYLSRIEEWCECTDGVWAMSECNACKEIVKRCRAVALYPDLKDEYYEVKVDFYKTKYLLAEKAKKCVITWEQAESEVITYCHSNGLSWFLIKRLHRELSRRAKF